MKATVQKIDLLEALDRVKGSVATNKLIQLLTTFCFKDGLLLGYNGQSGTQTKSPLGDMSFAVDAVLFHKVVSKMFDEIEITQKDNSIVLKSGSNKTQLQTISPDAYPDFLPKNTTDFCHAPNLINGLERVSFTVGTSPMKPQLLGACISNGYVYSSDGQRISRAKLNDTCNGSVTIPAASVEHVCKLGLCDGLFVEKNATGAVSRVAFHYASTETIYTTSALAQDFPVSAVDGLLEAPLNPDYTVSLPDELGDTIDRVTLLATEESGLVFTNIPGKGLRVQGMTKEIGEADEIIPWNFSHEFRFAARSDRVKKAFERTRQVDLSNVITGNKQSIRFSDDGFDHILALMLLTN